ncbi:MAG TPA: nucleotide disphospho-sugar-binding domain-containing protein [Chitinophagaceae bacterium]|jgi:UDP:flavonoid glycosyltransferase YjiC (YdhE family)|nr:nucleotide disphospho-sugar-binding domain-containing protein [Chitinophagaceae bacterium]
MKSKKILFANFPADGHFNPLTSLAVHLKNLGHDVRWYTGKKYQGKIEGMDIPFYPVKNAIDFSIGEPDQIFPERKNFKSQIAKLKFDIKHAFVLRGPEYYEDIKAINESFAFDIMIADNCFTGIPFVQQLLEKPVIAIGVVPLPETSKDLPPSGLGLTPSSTFLGKRKQDLMRFFTDKFIFGESKKLIDKLYKDYGMASTKGNVFDVICREADVLLQSGTPGFEYHRSDLGKNVRFIGPLLPYSKKKNKYYRLPALYRQYSKKILVTQGTVETDVEKIIVPTLEAFKNTDVLVVVTTGGSKTEELRSRYPYANILIDDFIPFNDIMPECDVYVTNGGYGGVLLGIQNKLPMVTAGMHEGKNEINARVGYFKLGINLKTEKPSPSQIKTSVEMIMRDINYKRNVVRLAEEFEQYNPAWLCEKHINQLLSKQEKSTRATFLKMIAQYAEEKVY